MKTLPFALALLATTAVTPVMAATVQAVSKVDAVTVFPSGAEVTRVAPVSLEAGEHELVFDRLPGELMPETIRVEGDAGGQIEIGSVDAKLVYIPSTDIDARRKEFEAKIQVLQHEREMLEQVIADAQYQKTLMQELASRANAAPEKDSGGRPMSAADLGQIVDLVGGKLQALSKQILDARVRQRELERAINDLSNQMMTLAPQEQARMQVTVHLAAPAPVSGSFRLKYRVPGAGWQPVYDARLASPAKGGKPRLELVRRAAVMQSTTEEWQDVALTLSTARPVGATAAPDIEPQIVDGGEYPETGGLVPQRAKKAPAPSSPAEADAAMEEKLESNAMLKDVMQREAEIEVAGFQALYGIPGRVSVDNTGTAKNVRIATDSLDVALSARSVPKLDPNAYLTASFTLNGETPLLPGTAMLYRDGVFMGQGYLPLLSPGEETKLGFGADDLIKVKRIEVSRKRGEEGLISTSNTDTRAYDITVKNLHDFAIPVTVLDQMPYATREYIVVETLPGMTPPTAKDFEKKRGVLAWSFDLDPKAEKVLKHGFKVTWPENLQVGQFN